MDTEESTGLMDNHETLISTTGVELFKSAWRNEKSAPEILQFEASLVQRIKEQIELASVPVPRPDTFLICKAKQYFDPGYSTEITEMESDLFRFACYKFIKKPLVNGFH